MPPLFNIDVTPHGVRRKCPLSSSLLLSEESPQGAAARPWRKIGAVASIEYQHCSASQAKDIRRTVNDCTLSLIYFYMMFSPLVILSRLKRTVLRLRQGYVGGPCPCIGYPLEIINLWAQPRYEPEDAHMPHLWDEGIRYPYSWSDIFLPTCISPESTVSIYWISRISSAFYLVLIVVLELPDPDPHLLDPSLSGLPDLDPNPTLFIKILRRQKDRIFSEFFCL